MNHPAFFENHPDPMWLVDPETWRFLSVNNAAGDYLGYTQSHLLSMSMADVQHPDEPLPAAAAAAAAAAQDNRNRVTRLRDSSGETLHAEIRWQPIDHDDRPALLGSVRDVTRLVRLEQQGAQLLERERQARLAAEAAVDHFRVFFESAPGRFLVVTPEAFEIVAVSDAYLEVTMTRRADIMGRTVFDVFPEDPADGGSEGVRRLRESLQRVRDHAVSDIMPLLRYPIRRPAGQGGGFEERFWSSVNTPVRGPDGDVVYIIHRAEDVTNYINASPDEARAVRMIEERDALLAQDILLRARELERATLRLQEQDINLRMAERLLKIGVWRGNTETGELRWSDNAYRIYGIEPAAFGESIDAYMQLVHPDDREWLASEYQAFSQSAEPLFDFQHRILKPDGTVAHVRFIGELTDSERGTDTVITGVVQDVTEQVEATGRLVEATALLRLAGDTAHLGGWRVDLRRNTVSWTPQTAAIHEEPAGYAPSIDEAIAYYAPEHRERLVAVFEACIERGEPYAEVMQIITARGRRVWVRTIGEAERDDNGEIVGIRGAFQDVSELVGARTRAEALSQRLIDTLESISDAFYTLDDDWRFTFVNAEAQRLLQRSDSELLRQRVWVSFPELVGTTFHREFLEARASRQTRRFEAFYPPLDAWFEVNAYPTSDHGLAVYFRDTSAHRQRDEQLRLLEAAVERQSDIVMITEADTIDAPEGPRIIYVNDAFVRRTGYTREEAIGRTPRMLQGPKTQRAELNRIREALEQDRPVRAELINYTRWGEEFWLELDVVPLANAQGKYTHYVAIERDVTERKVAEDALRESDERFQLLAKATNDAIWDWDFLNGTVWWNEGLRALFGHDPARVESGPESWINRIHPDDKERVLGSIQTVIDGAETRWSEEYRFMHADGHAVTVVDRGFLIRSESGVPLRMLGSMVDVTRQREQDDRLRQSQRLEAVGQLTGGVAHDFNNLLTVILGNSELLSERLTDQQQLRMLAEMTASAAERGAQLTNRLLAFSRRQALDPREVDVFKLVTGLDGMLRRLLRENIELQFTGGEPLWTAEVDPGQLEVALLNLVINARDALPDGGCLTIDVANAILDDTYVRSQEEVVAGHYVVIAVSDTGAGMSADVVARAFEPFFTTKEVGKGSGLGLSMVYGFIKQSGGHVRLYSEPGLGTTVRLYLPCGGMDAADELPVEQEAATIGGSEHVLVVEDDPLVREHLTAQLKGLGYRITSAGNGPQALQLLRALPEIDLLFTDVIMPGGMNGRELAVAALELRPELRVLFTSGYAESAVIHQGRLDKGVQLLSKPYRRQELAAKLRKVLDR